MEIKAGDIYWLTTKSDIPHPHIVIDMDDDEVTVCSITTNMDKAGLPGNVVLEPGEGGLEKQSAVEVSKTSVVGKSQLGKYIGGLDHEQINKILNGIQFVQRSFLLK